MNNTTFDPLIEEKEIPFEELKRAPARSKDGSTGDETIGVETVCVNDVAAQEIAWLWHPYIALGKVTLLEGDPGIGKSHASLAIAAGVAAGFGLPGVEGSGKPRNVLICSVEDDIADTIRPRLDRMRAHIENIHVAVEPFFFDEKGFILFEAAIITMQPALVIIDPIQGFVGSDVDMYRTNETRPILAKLATIANRNNCAILCIRHLTKGTGGKAIYRGGGSIDFAAAVRSILLAGSDPNDASKRAIVQIKSNLAAFGETKGYQITDEGFAWTGASNLTANEILGAPSQPESRRNRNGIEDASAFLEELLKDGSVAFDEIKDQAAKAGISKATLRRAKDDLGVKAKKQGYGSNGAWFWELTP